MTYFAFLIYFVIIPILALGLVILRKNHLFLASGFNLNKVWLGIGVHILLALIYTTPWDNYLVATSVWRYNRALVTGIVIGYVPIEEYIFFILETILSGLWWWFLATRLGKPNNILLKDVPNYKLIRSAAAILIVCWLFFFNRFFFAGDEWNYLSIIFLWALPAILPQLLFGADILWHHRKLLFWSVVTPGLYLSLIDIVALRATTWQISSAQTLGATFFGILPVEEVAFFFITNLLIVFGLTLMLSESGQLRLRAWLAKMPVHYINLVQPKKSRRKVSQYRDEA